MSTATSQLNISKVGRVCVTVADTDRAIDFYTGKLGLEKVADIPMGPDMRWVEVAIPREGGTAETTIALAPPPEGQEAGGSQTGIILDTTDVDGAPAGREAPGARGGRARRAEGRGRRRRRRDQSLRGPRAPDVLAPRSGRQLPHRRPAAE